MLRAQETKDQLSIAKKKGELYVKILIQEFKRELDYFWDVDNRRAPQRDTFATLIATQLKELAAKAPVASSAVDALASIVGFAANKDRDKRTATLAKLKDALDLNRLDILLDTVAREALRRYESFIVDWLTDELTATDGIILFAKVGAKRMLEYLSRRGQGNSAEGPGLYLSESVLLAGLIEGYSGSWIDGCKNHNLQLKTTSYLKAVKMSAESVYARPGLRVRGVEKGEVVDKLYLRHNQGQHQELKVKDRFKNLLKGKTEAFHSFGYSKLRKDNAEFKNDPKAGYVVMTQDVVDYYKYAVHQRDSVISKALQAEVTAATNSIVVIDAKTLADYIEWFNKASEMKEEEKNLLHYVGKIIGNNPSIQRVECHDDLSKLELKGVNLIHTDLSGSTLSGDLSNTRFEDSYLVGTHFRNVTSAQNACFIRAKAQFLRAEGVDFSGANFNQANLDYAVLNRAKFTRCSTLGVKWVNTELEHVEADADLLSIHEKRISENERELKEQRELMAEFRKEIGSRTQELYSAQQQLSQKLDEAIRTKITDALKDEEDEKRLQQAEIEINHLKAMQSQVQDLLHQQEARFAFEIYCKQELKSIRNDLDKKADEATVQALQENLETTQAQLRSLQNSSDVYKDQFQSFQKNTEDRFKELGASYDRLKEQINELQKNFTKQLESSIATQNQEINKLKIGFDSLRQDTQQLKSQMSQVEEKLAKSGPLYTLGEKLCKLRDSILKGNERLTTNELAVYIPPNGTEGEFSSNNISSLQEWVKDEFLAGEASSLLLQGPAGAGKSTFIRYLAHILWSDPVWEKFQAGQAIPKATVVLPIPLWSSKIKTDQLLKQRVPHLLLEPFTHTELEILLASAQLLICADAYDEIPHNKKDLGEAINLYNANDLEEHNLSGEKPKVKLLIGYRSQGDYQSKVQDCFVPSDNSQLIQRYIAPFNEQQTKDYLERYLAQKPELSWPVDTYLSYFRRLDGLSIDTPFLLKIAADALPAIVREREKSRKESKEHKQTDEIKLTRVELYKKFIDEWFVREEKKLLDDKLQKAAKYKKELQSINIKTRYKNFCLKLANQLWSRQQTTVQYSSESGSPKNFTDSLLETKEFSTKQEMTQASWAQEFFGGDELTELVRKGCPLQTNADNFHSFIHASLIEFFWAEYVHEKSKLTLAPITASASAETKAIVTPIAQPAIVVTTPFTIEQNPTIVEKPLVDIENLSSEDSLCQRQLSGVQVGFLVDLVNQDDDFKKYLINLIERSKREEKIAQAAANAITVLCAAQINFSHYNMDEVRIPKARLIGGIFDNTRFRKADLRGVAFHGSWLRQAIFDDAKMEGADFGEYAYTTRMSNLSLSEQIGLRASHFRYYSPDHATYAIAFDTPRPAGTYYSVLSQDIQLFDTKNQVSKFLFQEHPAEIINIAFSSNGKWVASEDKASNVYIWSSTAGTKAIFAYKKCKLPGSDYPRFKITTDADSEYKITEFGPSGGYVFSPVFNFLALEGMRSTFLFELDSKFSPIVLPGACPVYSRNGHYLITYDKKSSYITNLKSNKSTQTFSGIYSCLSADEKYLLTCGEDKESKKAQIYLWEINSGKLLRTFNGHQPRLSKDGRFLVSSEQSVSSSLTTSYKLYVWNIEKNTLAHTIEGKNYQTKSILHPHKPLMFLVVPVPIVSSTGWNDVKHTACLYELESGKNQWEIESEWPTDSKFSSSGDMIALGLPNRVELINTRDGTVKQIYHVKRNSLVSVDFSADEKYIVWLDDQKMIHSHAIIQDRLPINRLRDIAREKADLNVISPAGNYIATWERRKDKFKLFSAKIGNLMGQFDIATVSDPEIKFSRSGRYIGFKCGNYSTGRLATELFICDTATRALVATIRSDHMIHDFDFSYDDQQIATVGPAIRIWNIRGELKNDLSTKRPSNCTGVTWSPSGRYLACKGGQSIGGKTPNFVWDIISQAEQSYPFYTYLMTQFLFKNENRMELISFDEGHMRHWINGKQVGQFQPQIFTKNKLTVKPTVSFSPTYNHFVVVKHDCAEIWQMTSGTGVLGNIEGNVKQVGVLLTDVNQALWCFDGKQDFVVTFSSDGTIRHWKVTTDHELQISLISTTYQTIFNATGASINNVTGLDENNIALLQQRGAIGKPATLEFKENKQHTAGDSKEQKGQAGFTPAGAISQLGLLSSGGSAVTSEASVKLSETQVAINKI